MSVFIAYNAFASTQLPVEPNTSTTALGQPSTSISDFKRHNASEDVKIQLIGISLIEHTILPNGDSESNAVEVQDVNTSPRVNTFMKNSNLQYVAKIIESNTGVFQAGTYRAELYENDVSKGVLYIKQTMVEPNVPEGVLAAWDIGSDIPTNAIYTVKLTECPCY